MAMAISVRPVDLDSESGELLAILQANLPALPHARRFQWLYRDNPDGPAWSWFAFEKADGSVVGVTSVFPRSMWVGGRIRMCGQVGDFAISASHRSLGPAILLQRATFQPVDQRILAFCYDCPPHDAGMATFRRLRIEPSCTVTRYALPLRMDRRVKKHLGFVPPILTPLLNSLLRVFRRVGVKTGNLELSEHEGRFGDEFSCLDATVRQADVIRGCRTAAHLNWRYRDDPLQDYHVLTARRKGELIAFLIFLLRDEDITIVDLFGRDLPAAAIALLDALVQRYEVSCQGVEAFLSAYAEPGGEVSMFLERHPRWAFHTAEVQA
jgi:hypothetical protein